MYGGIGGVGKIFGKHFWGDKGVQTDFKHDLTAKKKTKSVKGGRRGVVKPFKKKI